MIEVALFEKGREINIPGYARRTVPRSALKGGVVIFGTPQAYHDVDDVTVLYPAGTNTILRMLKLPVPGGQGQFRHPGGMDLRILFQNQGTSVIGIPRSQEDVDEMRALLDSVELALD